MSTYTILIADDEPYVARVLKLVLQQEGHKVTCVNNGKEALDVYNKISPDIVITDVMMPHMGGRELVESIRRSGRRINTPVIVMTSTLESENREWVKDVGNISFIGKPVSPRELVRVVNDYCMNSQAS